MSPRRRVAVAVLVAWAITVGLITLRPTSMVGALSLDDFLCFWCSTYPAVDRILNWLMFVPGGLALRGLVGTRATIGIGAAATIGIEGLQVAIPGRHPSLADIVFNSAGVATGAWLHQVGPTPRLFRVGGVVAAALWMAPALLQTPTPRDAQLFAIWTPRFGGMAPYSGEVLRAEMAGQSLEYRIERSEVVHAALRARETLEVEFVAGTRTDGTQLIFGLWDEEQRPNLTVAADGGDLAIEWWSPAWTLGLDHLAMRSRGAIDGITPGDTVALRMAHEEGRWCVALDERQDCAVSPTLAEGWGLFLDSEPIGPGARRVLSVLWALGLGAMVGAGASGARRAAAAGLLAAAAGLVATGASPDVVAGFGEAAVLLGGTLLGASVRSGWVGAGLLPQQVDRELRS